MTEAEARDAIKGIEQCWDCEVIEVPQWLEALRDLDSATTAAAILRLYAKAPAGLPPTIAEVVECAAVIESMERSPVADADPPRPEPAVDAERGPFAYEVPAWTKGWAVARYRHKDHRVFAEQKVGYDSHQIANPGYRTYVWPEQEKMPPEEAAAYIEEGAPLGVDEIFRMITA